MITSNVTKEIELPHEPGVKITVRMLSHGQMKRARDSRLSELAQMTSQIDMGAMMDRMDDRKVTPEDVEDSDPLAGYDVTVLLRKGIKAWTYDQKVTSEVIDELDEATAEFVATEIVNLSRRRKVEGEASSERSPVSS